MKLKTWVLGLVLALLSAGTALATLGDDLAKWEARLEALQDGLKQARAQRIKAYRAAETEEERMQALEKNPWDAFAPQAEQLALEAKGTEVAAQAWAMIFSNAGPEVSPAELQKVFGTLIAEHPNSLALLNVLSFLHYMETDRSATLKGLRHLVETSTESRVRAASLLSLAKHLEADEATREEALKAYRLILEKYPKEANTRGSTFASVAEASLYEAEHLQVGMPVPDVASSDETQTAFKLSDYRGKVVLLDFWGFW